MDGDRFDRLTTIVSGQASRRGVLGLLGSIVGGVAAPPYDRSVAKKHHHKHKKSCPSGQQRCGKKCADLDSDPNHCGACGADCRQVCCSGTCVDVLRDANNCGECGQLCSEQEECVNGECKTCPRGQTRCSPQGEPSYCADLSNDTSNCGHCGTVCALDEQCETTSGGTIGTCTCDGPFCPTASGQRCCPAAGGVCCAGGKCCHAGEVCQTGDQCCPNGEYLCPDGATCCPQGTSCTGSGQCERSGARSSDRASHTAGSHARPQLY
jgi:hypothetical protein